MGNGNLKAQCSITNFSATDATCGTGFNEDDSFFSVTFDVVDGSGTYILINPANNISYGTGVNEPTNGTVSFLGQASITGVTPGNTTQVMLIDAMNASSCTAGPITINVPICPPSDVTPPTSACADPIEVSSTNCGDGLTPNTVTAGLWASIPASGMLTIGIGLGANFATFPIDFNCLMDETDPIGELDISLASSAFVTGPDPCMIYLQNTYDIRDASENIAPELLTIVAAYAACDMEPPVVTCAEFTGSGNSCPNLHDPNTPNGIWISVPASGTFISAVGGGVVTGTIDLNGCVTDNMSALDEMEFTLMASFQENVVPGCSKDIINEYQIRDACGNISPNTFIFRGTIIFDGDPPVITCPANATVECGSSTDPAITGMATATSDCGSAIISFTDGPLLEACGGTGSFVRTWTATDGCGNSSGLGVCTQTITLTDNTPPEVTCDEFSMTFSTCPNFIFPNTPSGNWIPVPASGTFQSAVGGSFIQTVDLNGCVTDNCSTIGDLEWTLVSSFEENRVPGCSVDIINELGIRDGCENESMTTIIVRSTLQFDGPAPVITCPVNATINCEDSTAPATTGMATATSDCGNPEITFSDVSTQGQGCSANSYIITRTWSAMDGVEELLLVIKSLQFKI